MNVHVFITTLDPRDPDDEVEVRFLFDTFMVSLYKGDVEVSHYDRFDYRTALQCHRNAEGWEEQPCA